MAINRANTALILGQFWTQRGTVLSTPPNINTFDFLVIAGGGAGGAVIGGISQVGGGSGTSGQGTSGGYGVNAPGGYANLVFSAFGSEIS